MSTRNLYIIIFFLPLFLLISCTTEQVKEPIAVDDHAMIYNELLNMEHAILTSEFDKAKTHSEYLDELLKDGYKLFCPNESAQIDGARMTNYILRQNLPDKKIENSLDDLRMLKATIINLETDDDYDPYFAFLWKYEEEMHATTKVAIDPMLDLYEWNEFEDMVACMNQTWQPVKMHYPSPEHLDLDPAKYKNQTTHKIYLENAMINFNKAVNSSDYIEYPLCESAEALRAAYIDYINTFIKTPYGSNFILAKI